MSGRERGDGYRLSEDYTLILRAAVRGQYKAVRYQELRYDHPREEAIGELETIRDMIDETLEGHREAPDG